MASDARPGSSDIIIEDVDPRGVRGRERHRLTYHFTDSRNAWVTCSFTDTHVWYIANTRYDHGTNSIVVDDKSVVLVSSFSPEQEKGQIIFHDELHAGPHTINVTNLDPLRMGLDRFAYRPIGIPSFVAQGIQEQWRSGSN
ncbi:hypothetical protein AURDEDRAFT_118858 [Auricularia subglabra TFB-10046 SS5]|nr:hypothetical protein AURDEDRAFT_118858 [Auricularia subglabra TFB-10046 SS5]